jgi:hypothetical protein
MAAHRTLVRGGHIVAPGLIDTHRHTRQSQPRALCADWTLTDYLAGSLTPGKQADLIVAGPGTSPPSRSSRLAVSGPPQYWSPPACPHDRSEYQADGAAAEMRNRGNPRRGCPSSACPFVITADSPGRKGTRSA